MIGGPRLCRLVFGSLQLGYRRHDQVFAVLIFAGVLGILGLLAEGTLARMKDHGHAGNGHKSVKISPPTACGLAGSDALDAEILRKEEAKVRA